MLRPVSCIFKSCYTFTAVFFYINHVLFNTFYFSLMMMIENISVYKVFQDGCVLEDLSTVVLKLTKLGIINLVVF